jgi:hypothetical protein
LRRRKGRIPALPWGPTLLAGLHAGVALKKKKTPTIIKKQTEAHLHESYFRFIKVQQCNPDYWVRKLRYDDFDDSKFMIAMAERARDAGRMSEEAFEEFKRELGGLTIAKVYLREKLGSEIESYISEGDPILSIKEQLKPPLELLVDLFTYVFNPFPNEKLPVSLSGKGPDFKIDLRFTDNKIMEAIGRYLGYFLSPVGQRVLDFWDYRPQVADGQVLEVIRDPGKGPYGPDLESSMLIVSINFDAGKMKIREELKGELKKFSLRDTVPTPKFSKETWIRDYEIYRLRHDEGWKFPDIATKLARPKSTVESAFKRIFLHIHQRDEYGTKETREGLKVDITKGLLVPLDEAEVEYVRMQMLGGFGNKMAASGAYEDKEGDFIVQEPQQDPLGYYKFCNPDVSDLVKPIPLPSFFYSTCKYKPGSEACLTCTPWRKSETFIGNMEGILYFRRKFLPPRYPGSGKIAGGIIQPDMVGKELRKKEKPSHVNVGHNNRYLAYWEWKHHWLLEQIAFARGYYYDYRAEPYPWREKHHPDLLRKDESVLQADYIEEHEIVPHCPWEPPKEEDNGAIEIVPQSSSDYSLSFNQRCDHMESAMIDLIAQQIDPLWARRARISEH